MFGSPVLFGCDSWMRFFFGAIAGRAMAGLAWEAVQGVGRTAARSNRTVITVIDRKTIM